jgi:anti-sigma regulatory factor (Ser/Thr protein kinase)
MSPFRDFPNSPEGVGAARLHVTEQLEGTSTQVLEVVKLLLSELATNAVVHAATSFSVEVTRVHGQIRVSVIDHGRGEPRLQIVDPSAAHGRGLQIVDALSNSWGIERDAHSKTVWFVVSETLDPTQA